MSNRSSIETDELQPGQSGKIGVLGLLEYSEPFAATGNQLVYADWVLARTGVYIGPVSFFRPAGQSLPIQFTAFQTLYAAYGRFPKVTSKQVLGQGILTGTLIGGTGYTNGTYAGKVLTGGSGAGAIATIVVAGGTITSVTITKASTGYTIGDALSAAGLGAGTGFGYTVATVSVPSFQYSTGETVTTTEVTPGLPDVVAINAEDDGTGHLQCNVLITISI